MRIVCLQAENIKRLSAVEIRPDGNLVEITGKNGQGKTSVLDAIWWALAGTKHVQSAPIRKGEDEARIRLDMGELIVTRKFRRAEDGGTTTSIVVQTADGARYSSPQAVLDGLVGALSFDPLAFSRLDGKGRFEALRRLAPGVDFDGIDQANKADFDKRTLLNRRLKELRGAAASIIVPDDTPEEPIDEAALIEQLDDAGRQNTEIEQRKADLEKQRRYVGDYRRDAKQNRDEAEELRKRAAKLDEEAAEFEATADKLEKEAEATTIPPQIDTSVLRTKINTARKINADVSKRKEREKYLEHATVVETEAKALTAAIDKRKEEKLAAIAAAEMPVPGLAFGESDEVLFNGVPFDQASDAEQLRVSIAIAMAMNPKLRVIRVRDGSLLDDEAMKLLAEMADANDCQCWIERVDGSGKVGFVIEDGRLKTEVAEAAE